MWCSGYHSWLRKSFNSCLLEAAEICAHVSYTLSLSTRFCHGQANWSFAVLVIVQPFPVNITFKEKYKLISNILTIEREITSEWKDRIVHTEMNNVVIGNTGENSEKIILLTHTSLSTEGPVITLMTLFLFCTTSPILLSFSQFFHRNYLVHKIKTFHS